MKCELCHQAEATTAVTLGKDGAERELYVCPSCAAQVQGDARRKGKPSSAPKVMRMGGPDEPPPPFVEEFVKATLGFMKEVAEAEHNDRRACPVCKSKWDAVKERGRLGCPTCWKTFARQIRAEFLSAQFGNAHLGKAPAIEKFQNRKDIRSVLERDLRDAVAREDFHRAALLKKKLDALGKEPRE